MDERYYIMDGFGKPEPVGLMEWAHYLEGRDRVMAQDFVGNTLVSTVFLGLNMRFGKGKPLLWESMSFPDNSYMESKADRYTSFEKAADGHWRMLEEVKSERNWLEVARDWLIDWWREHKEPFIEEWKQL